MSNAKMAFVTLSGAIALMLVIALAVISFSLHQASPTMVRSVANTQPSMAAERPPSNKVQNVVRTPVSNDVRQSVTVNR